MNEDTVVCRCQSPTADWRCPHCSGVRPVRRKPRRPKVDVPRPREPLAMMRKRLRRKAVARNRASVARRAERERRIAVLDKMIAGAKAILDQAKEGRR